MDTKAAVDTTNELTRLAAIGTGAIPLEWEQSHLAEIALADLEREPVDRARFAPLPGIASQAKQYEVWKSALSGWVYRTHTLELFPQPECECPCRDLVNRNAISGCDLQQAGREQRDQQSDALRKSIRQRLQPSKIVSGARSRWSSGNRRNRSSQLQAATVGATIFRGRSWTEDDQRDHDRRGDDRDPWCGPGHEGIEG